MSERPDHLPEMTPERLREIESLLRYESSISFQSGRAHESMWMLVAEARRLRNERDAARSEVMAELLDARRRAEQAERRAGDAEKHLIDSAGFDMADLMRSLDECVDRAEQAEATLARVREMVDQPAVILNPREVIVRYENIRRTVVRYENIRRALDGNGDAT